MTIPNIPEFLRVAQMLNGLVPELSKVISPAIPIFKAAKDTKGFSRNLTSIAERAKFIEGEFELNKGQPGRAVNVLKKSADEAKKITDGTKKVADNAKKIQDAFFKNMPGGANPKNSGIAGGQLISILIQGGLAVAVIQNTLIQNGINDLVDKQLLRIGFDGSKTLTSLGTLYSRVANLNTKLERFDKDLNANAKDYLQLNKQQEATSKNLVEVKKQSNDTLYEARKGREIVTGLAEAARKLANDALYEARQNKRNVDGQITGLRSAFDAKIQSINSQISSFTSKAGDTFQTAINGTIAKIQASLSSTQAQIASIKQTPVDANAIVARAVNEAKAVVAPAIDTRIAATNAKISATDARVSGVQGQISVVAGAIPALATGIQSVGVSASRAESTTNVALAAVKIEGQKSDAILSGVQGQIATLAGAIPALTNAIQSTGTLASKADGTANTALAKAKLNRTEAEKLEEKFKKSVADNAKAFGIRDLSQTELSKQFDKINADFTKDADIAAKIADGNTALAEQRWQQTLRDQEEWLAGLRKVETTVTEFKIASLDVFRHYTDVQISKGTSFNSQALSNAKQELQQQINNSENRTNEKIEDSEENTNRNIDRNIDTVRREMEEQGNDFEKLAEENATIAKGDTKLAEQKWDQTVKELERTFDRKQNNSDKSLSNRIDKETIERKREDKSIVTTLGGQITNIEQQLENPTNTTPEVPQLRRELEKVKQDLTKIKPEINDLKNRTKEQEKVNGLALPKLDQISAALGLLPGRAAAAIKPSIPTLPQIENAAATGTCRTTQPGGCMSKALDNNAANINNNTNANTGNVLGAVNAIGQGADLALLGVINNKLGNQLPGGIGGKLSRFADWMHLDRVLNIMILAAAIHNALMLSNDIGQTLVGAFNNVLQLIGLKKEDGSAFDIGSVISSSIENLIKGAIGADNYIELKEAWAKANRIYQATINIFNALQGLSSAILTGLEMTAGKVAKIGNALRNAGQILENAYGWMNPQPKFNRVTQGLENLQAGASTIQMVTQAPLDIINATTELANATTELTKAIKEDENPANKGKESPEPDKLKADQATAKLASAGLELIDIDLDPDD